MNSYHTQNNEAYNNNTYGVGIEYTKGLTYGAYVYRNSFDDVSLMGSVSKQWHHFGAGVAVANGYDKNPFAKNGLLISPEFTIQINNYFRLKTSYPAAQLMFGDKKADVFNFQLTMDLY